MEWIPIVSALIFCVLTIVNYIIALVSWILKKLPSAAMNRPVPPEPAYKNYFFRQAYLDYWFILRRSVELCILEVGGFISVVGELMSEDDEGCCGCLILILTIMVLGGVLIGGVPFLIFSYVAFGLLHLLIVLIVCGIGYVIALYFFSIERLSMVWRRISYVCPHCYKPIALPVHLCSDVSCGAQHRKLIPGSYGIFKHRCQCGTRLPASVFWGRRKLQTLCPHCLKPLNVAIGTSSNLHLPIVGGPAAGKSSFLMACILEIVKDSVKNGRSITFPETRDERTFLANKRQFEQGMPLLKTADLSPTAFLLKVAEPDGTEYLLYVYDAAGELYADSGDVRRRHEYFSMVDGILFLVDPFSIKKVRSDYQSQIAEIEGSLKPSAEAPQDVYDRMITTLRTFSKSKRELKRKPLAVVVTKLDSFDLATQICFSSREWLLKMGEGNLVRSIERDFDQVQYYACSALGHFPDGRTPFQPVGVIEPLRWSLQARPVKVAGAARKGTSWKSETRANWVSFLMVTFSFAALVLGLWFTLQVLGWDLHRIVETGPSVVWWVRDKVYACIYWIVDILENID
ncbi:MAG: hypothetical protein ABH878_08630 [bacterium]